MQVGTDFARGAKPGDVFRLIGELGSGKTTFARGFIQALGFDGEVRSPTFNLVHVYDTSPPVCHADLYRLDLPRDVAHLGLSDYAETHVLLIEWAERAAGLFAGDSTTLRFFIEGGNRRVETERAP